MICGDGAVVVVSCVVIVLVISEVVDFRQVRSADDQEPIVAWGD